MKSIWQDDAALSYPEFEGEASVDVAIIGGGICGLSAAQILSHEKFKVMVLEGRKISDSTAARSTGNLYCLTDAPVSTIKSKHGKEILRRVLNARREALDLIQSNVIRYNIDCDFQRVPWIRFSAIPEMDQVIHDDYHTLLELGFSPEWLESSDPLLTSFGARRGIKLEGQAQFNPAAYLNGLAREIQDRCVLHENSRVISLEEKTDWVELKTEKGFIRAKHVIEATHTPLGISSLQTMLGPYREYGTSYVFPRPFAPGIYWGYYERDKTTSVRTYQNRLLVIGEPHKVGQGNSFESLKRLEYFAHDHFEARELTHEWAGQHYRPADYLPYIGRRPKSKVYQASGFSTDGLVYGVLAAIIIGDEILGKKNSYTSIFKLDRITPLKSAKRFLHENLNVMKEYLVDYLDREEFKELNEGEGMVAQWEGKKIAICREGGELKAASAICPHLGCVVHWNGKEKSWDCPCHGSRFDVKGQVIEGPSLSCLESLSSIPHSSQSSQNAPENESRI